MTDPDDDSDSELETEGAVYLQEETCWVADPDYLLPDSGVQGVIAMQFRGGELFYLDGETRRWTNAEAPQADKPARKLRPVN